MFRYNYSQNLEPAEAWEIRFSHYRSKSLCREYYRSSRNSTKIKVHNQFIKIKLAVSMREAQPKETLPVACSRFRVLSSNFQVIHPSGINDLVADCLGNRNRKSQETNTVSFDGWSSEVIL